MTLFSIAKKNILGNLKNYIIYFISMILSIVIYYAFVSLRYNDSVIKAIDNFTSLESIFIMSSMIIILFSLIFIFYSNAFFIRGRKKEIGLYSIVGIPKKTIGKMMFFENLIMGLISLVIGIILGLLFSRFFAMILINLIDNSLSIDFSFSFKPILNTITVFLFIIILTSIKAYMTIYKFKLVDLFKNDNENLKMPINTQLSYLSAVISIIMLIISFYISTKQLPKNSFGIIVHMLLIIVNLIVGNYLLFNSCIPYILKLLKKYKKHFYKDINMISTSHLLYRIKGNINTLTITALLSALTISLFATVFSQYKSSNQLSKNFAPFSYTHLSKGSDYDNKIKEIIENDENHPVKYAFDIPVIEVDYMFKGPKNYSTPKLRIIPETVYNNVSKALYNQKPISLSNNNALAIQPLFTDHSDSDYKNLDINLDIKGTKYNFNLSGMVTGRILTWDNPDFFIIIKDDIFNEIKKSINPLVFKAYEVLDENDTKSTSAILKSLNSTDTNIFSSSKDNSQIFTYYEVYKKNLDESSLILFVVSFLGCVFSCATGSILYFKQLTDATENKDYYNILFKLGITKKEVYLSIVKQNLFIFAIPLFIALFDSIIILNFLTNFISNLIGSSFIIPIFISLISFIFIYFVYYILTVNTYNTIISN